MKCGDFLLVQYPFTDGSAAKLRPVLVVSSDKYNFGGDVVVLPVSSQPDRSDPYSFHIDMDRPEFKHTRLKHSSAIKWNKPLTVAKSVVLRKLGNLKPPYLEEVRKKTRALFS